MSNLFVVFFYVVFPWLAFTTHAREAVEFIKFIIFMGGRRSITIKVEKTNIYGRKGKSDFT